MAKSKAKKALIWSVWLALCLGLAGYLGYEMFAAKQKPNFLIGTATDGHHQIEMACTSCHTEPFGGKELVHNACLSCHKDELNAVDDSHPIKKFTDPRNADRVAILDARNCVTCHNEHQMEQTGGMGLTLPEDYCFRCHEDVAEERPSHQGMGFDTCASAGCHNYHDNTALYEAFLVKHQDEPAIDWQAQLMPTSITTVLPKQTALTLTDADHKSDEKIAHDWAESVHAEAGVNCAGCHANNREKTWTDKPEVGACKSCHQEQLDGFFEGKHGMKLAAGLGPMTPAQGRLPFHSEAANDELNCASCHDPHKPDLKVAAVESCLGCHNDEHSNAYKDSPHAALWQKELSGELPAGSGVTCATCHMPRVETESMTTGDKVVMTQHNQNLFLRPNEKMLRSSCMSCHSLEFGIDALADPQLIQNNFKGKPGVHIKSIDMAVEESKKE